MRFLISIERVSFNFAFDVEMNAHTPTHIPTNELIRLDFYFAICLCELWNTHTHIQTHPHTDTSKNISSHQNFDAMVLRDTILCMKLYGKKISVKCESKKCKALAFIYTLKSNNSKQTTKTVFQINCSDNDIFQCTNNINGLKCVYGTTADT